VDNMKRIVKPNYHLASQKELRGICETHGISTHGDKPVLVERLQMWISIYK
jgi:E3 ubiquitin-protein ligase RAD18